MKDFLGNELKVGDKVVFIAESNSFPHLQIGTIQDIQEKNNACTIDDNYYVFFNRVMKFETN